jgi:ditrans,polycis-polyprenyl diphosphate synthase
MKLGVSVVTVYAFSIENFNRDPQEVEYLFSMFEEKLNLLSEKGWV